MGLQVKEKAIDKGKWSGRARPRSSPAQVCPVCARLLASLIACLSDCSCCRRQVQSITTLSALLSRSMAPAGCSRAVSSHC